MDTDCLPRLGVGRPVAEVDRYRAVRVVPDRAKLPGLPGQSPKRLEHLVGEFERFVLFPGGVTPHDHEFGPALPRLLEIVEIDQPEIVVRQPAEHECRLRKPEILDHWDAGVDATLPEPSGTRGVRPELQLQAGEAMAHVDFDVRRTVDLANAAGNEKRVAHGELHQHQRLDIQIEGSAAHFLGADDRSLFTHIM